MKNDVNLPTVSNEQKNLILGVVLKATEEKSGTDQRSGSVSRRHESGTLVTSVADPYPHGSAFILVGWIRVRIGNTYPDPGGPK